MPGFDISNFDLALSLALGIALAAATGFRVFLPMLVASAAAYSGNLPLGENFAWLATPAAVTLLGVAAVVEAAAYYIPGVDNLLDTIATPVIVDMPPLIKWAMAIIAGGGIAGLTQGTTALVRAKSTVMTGTLGNPVLATAEVGGSLLLSILALLSPIAALLLVVGLFWLAIRLLRKLTRTSKPAQAPRTSHQT